MDSGGDASSLGGTLLSLHPIIHRLYLVLKKRSLRKEYGERLSDALGATEEMDKALTAMAQCGKECVAILETPTFPMGVAATARVYKVLASWMFGISDMVLALSELAQQAERVSRFTTFMEDLKRVDRLSFEFIGLLARANKSGLIDTSEFPLFGSLYLPRKMNKQLSGEVDEKLRPLVKGMEEMAWNLPPPFRPQIPPLRRGLEKMKQAGTKLSPMSDQTRKQLRKSSPEWAATVSELIEQGWETGMKIAKSRNRARAPSPSVPELRGKNQWKRNWRKKGMSS